MCRSTKHGSGRRCPSCGSYAAVAKANANRRLSREARKKVVDHLREQGLVETAAALQAAPPSVLAEFMEKTGLDPEILGDTPMPSTHSKPPSAAELVALAESERARLAGTPAQHAAQKQVTELEQQRAAAVAAVTETAAALEKAEKQRFQAEISDSVGSGSAEKLAAATEAYEEAKKAAALAEQRAAETGDDLEAAKCHAATVDKAPEEQDAYYASMTDEQVDAVVRSAGRHRIGEAEQVLASAPQLELAERDTSIYTSGSLSMDTGKEVTTVEGRLLDGGTAIHRRSSGDFVILQKAGDHYHPVGVAGSKNEALKKANRIPAMSGLEALGAEATDMEKGAWQLKKDLALEVARAAGDGTSTTLSQHKQLVTDKMTDAAGKLSDEYVGMPVRAEILDGTRRHRTAMRLRAADEAGSLARQKALAAGASEDDAALAYKTAYNKALGTPTVGGGVIPHFDHDPIPASLGESKHAALARSGIRALGRETADDYAVIGQRGGDLVAWGFHSKNNPGTLTTSNINTLTEANRKFLDKELNYEERRSLRTYTGGDYMEINAAITGRDPHPSTHTKAVVSQLTSAFDKFSTGNPNIAPMTVIRGTRVPSGWKGTTEEYLAAAFTTGSKIEMGKVTSFSTSVGTAKSFANGGHDKKYLIVALTRQGIPVESISQCAGENEVIVPPGAGMRTVRIDKHGIGGVPTVYMVGEDLCAEADDGVGITGFASTAAAA